MSTTLFSTMRDEAPFILEWVAYHKEIGFDQIVVFSNDCSDGTDLILDALDAQGIIKHVRHEPTPNESVALQVGRAVLDQDLIGDGNWAIWLDADEFLNVHAGEGRVADLVAAIGDARGMCVSWRVFGDAGQDRFQGTFLADPFVQCAAPGEAWQNVKTIFRHGADVTELFQHKPILTPEFWAGGGTFLSSTGAALDNSDPLMAKWIEGQKRGKIAEAAAGWQVAQINHYAVRTQKLFARKQSRGRIGEPNSTSPQRYNNRYYRGLNLDSDEDRTILRWAERTKNRTRALAALIRPQLDVQSLIAQHYPIDTVKIEAPQTATASDVRRYQDMHKSHHEEIDDRKYSNNRLAQLIHQTCKPRTILDVGCGIGLLLSYLKQSDAAVTGLEGMWLDDGSMILSPDHYIRMDLEQPITLDQTFDLCCCIEVAEHLAPDRAESFVADLCSLSDVVVFSAAIGGQGGKGHKNEQWQEYWCDFFEAQGYGTYDPFRQTLRRDPKVLPWFQQNVLVFIRSGNALADQMAPDRIAPAVANMILPTYHKKILRRTRKRHRRMLKSSE